MVFKKILEQINLGQILSRVEYKSILLENALKIYNFIDDIIKNNRKVLLYGDYDPDGMMCIMVWKEFFRNVGFKNYTIFTYGDRMHTLDPYAVRQAIRMHYDYIIINDTCTNEMDKINELIKFGVRIILLDHHETKYKYSDYPSNCAIVNSTLETENKIKVSAGALVYIVLEYYLKTKVKMYDDNNMVCYALISLYADCIEMSNEINRAIYYKATAIDQKYLPAEVRMFMKPYDKFSRRFIEFRYTPKLNCAFRQELFMLLNDYVKSKYRGGISEMKERIDTLTDIHKKSVEMTERVTDIITTKELDNFILANINSVNSYVNVAQNKLFNYTGLVANKLADRHGKCCVVWCSKGKEIKGSFRDLQARDYLKVFQQFCDAQGHKSAFGIHINPLEFNMFLKYIEKVDSMYEIEAVDNKPIIVEHAGIEPDLETLEDMALYNEFSGQIPIALIKVKIGQGFRQTKNKFSGYRYRWGSLTVTSSRRLSTNKYEYLKPTVGKKLKLYVV